MSHRARLLSLTLRATVRPVIAAWCVAPRLPWPYGVVDLAGLLVRPVRGTRFVGCDLNHTRAQWITTPASSSDRVILYFPGGAFLVGGWFLHRGMLSRIARATRSRILAVEYRKLPAHPVTESVADCVEAYRHLLAEGVAPENIVLMGDSAGGFLTIATAAELRRTGLPAPAALVALSPLCELTDAATTAEEALLSCALFGPASLPGIRRLMSDLAAPEIVDADDLAHRDLPPVLLQAARDETLFPQIQRLADRLEDCGASYDLQVWDHDLHVFQAAGWLPESVEALAGIVEFVDEVFEEAEDRVSS